MQLTSLIDTSPQLTIESAKTDDQAGGYSVKRLQFVLVAAIAAFALIHPVTAFTWKDVGKVIKKTADPTGPIDDIKRGVEVLKGEKSAGDAVKEKVDQEKERIIAIAKLPGEVSKLEQRINDALSKFAGKDLVSALRTLQLPEQVMREAPLAGIMAITGEGASNPLEAAAAIPLSSAIRQAITYYEDKSIPLPEEIAILLASTFKRETLLKARYTIDGSLSTLPAIINNLKERTADNHAVVVGNIIVFAKEPQDSELFFWAHEVRHTEQYAEWGIDKFAAEYITNHKAIERDADSVAADAVDGAKKILAALSIAHDLRTSGKASTPK
jgi:hypothetical protein